MNEKIILNLQEVKTLLLQEMSEPTTKKDKKQVNSVLVGCINHLLNKGVNSNILLEKTNTNRKNSKCKNALHFNSGVLFEILLNIVVDYNNNELKDNYYKQPMKKADININGIDYEIKLVSKYSLSAPQKNNITDYLIGIIDNDGFTIKQLNSQNIQWHYCKLTQKDGSISKKRQVALIQSYGVVRVDLMRMLGVRA